MYKQTVLPMYRGFNLSYLMVKEEVGKKINDIYVDQIPRDTSYSRIEEDLEIISDLGFNFARFPLNYRNFIKNYEEFWQGGEFQFDEEKIEKIDKAVDYAGKLGIYLEFGLHRAPGYSVLNEMEEPFNLWTDLEAQRAFARIWQAIALRYKGIPSEHMGYNLINEPHYIKTEGYVTRGDHKRIMKKAIDAIRDIGDKRTIFVDGVRWGRDYLPEMCDIEGVAQSTRAYDPGPFTHYGIEKFQINSTKWPGIISHDAFSWDNLVCWDYDRLYKHYEGWAKMAQEFHVGVHCGEGGVYKGCPHEDAVKWFRDVMEILTGFHIGFAMWELRGPFGIIDSGRTDCKYGDYKGHLIDYEMLDIMKKDF